MGQLFKTAEKWGENSREIQRQAREAIECGEREFMPLDHHMRAKTFLAKRCQEIIAESDTILQDHVCLKHATFVESKFYTGYICAICGVKL